MAPRTVKSSNVNAKNTYTTLPAPFQEVFNAEFQNVIQMLDHSVTNQNNQRVQVLTVANVGSAKARMQIFF